MSTYIINEEPETLIGADADEVIIFDESLGRVRKMSLLNLALYVDTKEVTRISDTYTILASDRHIVCLANSFTVTLPPFAEVLGRKFEIKNSGAGSIVLDGDDDELIDGLLTQTIPAGSNLPVLATITGWIIL